MRYTMQTRSRAWLGLSLATFLLFAAAPLQAQTNAPDPSSIWRPTANADTIDYDAILAQEGYLRPPEIIERAVLVPRHLQVNLNNASPDGRSFLITRGDGMPSLEDFARRHYNLAGWQIDPVANRARNMTSRGGDVGLDLFFWENDRTISAQIPRGTRISGSRWSPDGSQIAFYGHTEQETHIYVVDAGNGRVRQVTRTPVLATHVTSFEWLADGQSIVTVLLPNRRGPEPNEGAAPSTPIVRVAEPVENRLRTYASLLESPRDMALVEYYSTGQLAKVSVRNRRETPIGEPGMIRRIDASPDGKYFRVTLLTRPFSYIVPVSQFGSVEEIWDEQGNKLTELSSTPLREGARTDDRGDDQDQPQESPRRSLSWRTDGEGMTYLQRDPPRSGSETRDPDAPRGPPPAAEQQPGARPQAQAQAGAGGRRDKLIHWLPPFTDESTEVIYETTNQITSVRYSDEGNILFLTETEDGFAHTFAVDRSDPGTRHTITRVRSGRGGSARRGAEADTTAPGSLMTTRGRLGLSVARISSDGRYVFLSGSDRGQEEGEEEDEDLPRRPFIDKLELLTGERARVFQGSPDFTESVSAVLDHDVNEIVLSRQNRTMVPQSIYVNLTTGRERVLTRNQDYTLDELKNVQRMTFEAPRVDGLMVRVRVTLPADFQEGDRLPAMFWFYPREYSDFDAYYRSSRGSGGTLPDPDAGPGRYPTFSVSSVQLLTLLGYAVVEPDAPIVGPEGRMNDNYVHDLRNNHAAVIDECERRGLIDRTRLGIGGHSYGGFSTINTLVHTPFFKAGIAGASNSNRLLTPLGFQSERRDLWSARETYLSMSGFLYANQLTGALLQYHGVQDQNVGTAPINSERLFHALNGLGKTTALFMYPYEDHGQATLETRLDMWARWVAWLEKYVKHAQLPGTDEEKE